MIPFGTILKKKTNRMATNGDDNSQQIKGRDASTSSYVIDRTIYVTLPSDILNAPTPSQLCSIPSSQEQLYRIYGASLIHSASVLLRFKNPSTKCTSCTLFHRFYYRESLTKYDVWSVAMACILAGGKIEDDARSVRQIILVFHHLFRRRRLQLGKTEQHAPASPLSQHLSKSEKENLLRSFMPSLNPYGQIYQEYQRAITTMEQIILRSVGFTVYWIPHSHPHSFLLYFCKVLEMQKADAVQTAWNYCNDSTLLDVCVRYKPQVTACAAIYLAAKQVSLSLPMKVRPWWQVFIGEGCEAELSIICNALLALQDESVIGDAFGIFLPSLLPSAPAESVPYNSEDDGYTGSFNDPGSFLWSLMDMEETKT